ncbi:MAG: hypothetical protein RLZZ163_999 [Actinomycetota bacterium]
MSRASSSRRAGFSLVEMLLAVFILGIGVISIASLFPAGIALQRQATDATVGPIVAKNALALIRSKLSQDDFGSFEDFGGTPDFSPVSIGGTFQASTGERWYHQPGDWCWMRPAVRFDPPFAGTIDVFASELTRLGGVGGVTWASELLPSGSTNTAIPLYGMPYNPQKFPLFTLDQSVVNTLDPLSKRLIEPAVTFTQGERSYPQVQGSIGAGAPLYYWDCMFRRQGGRVQVAVFVYRVTAPGGVASSYSVQPLDTGLVGLAPAGTTQQFGFNPPIPSVRFAPGWGTPNSWPNRSALFSNALYDEARIPQTDPGSAFGNGRTWDDWMAPGQLWVDNHGNRHEVLRGRLLAGTPTSALPNQGPVRLARRIPNLAAAPAFGFDLSASYQLEPPQNGGRPLSPNRYIGAIWYVPLTDAAGNVITPVYVAVEEL